MRTKHGNGFTRRNARITEISEPVPAQITKNGKSADSWRKRFQGEGAFASSSAARRELTLVNPAGSGDTSRAGVRADIVSSYAGGMRLVLTSDTHLPKRARDLPPQLWAAIDESDVVVHAGDWVDSSALDAVAARSARLIACYGNNDGPALRARLPEIAYATLDGLRLAVVHETGPSAGREERCAARFPGVDLLVFGHSHIPWDTTAATGLRLLNPGSPTDRRRQPFATYQTATIEAGELTDVRLHELPPRPPSASGGTAHPQ